VKDGSVKGIGKGSVLSTSIYAICGSCLNNETNNKTTIKLQQSEQNDNDMCCGNKKPCFTLAFSIKLQNQFSPQISIFTFVSICIFLMLQGEAKARGACLELHRSTGANR